MTESGVRPLEAARRAFRGELPERYQGYPESFKAPFTRAVGSVLAPGQHILDVGGGRTATIAPEERPAGCRLVGLDVSGSELLSAPAGSYDDIVVGDITEEVPELKEQFDLILSFQAMEHVEDLDPAFANMHTYLRPGGHLVAQFSGTFSFYGLLSRAIPDRPTRWLQHRLYGREPDTVFRAHYDKCYFRALERLLAPWDEADITPLWTAEPYVHFSRILRSSYILYEEWARERRMRDLAPYYLVVARR